MTLDELIDRVADWFAERPLIDMRLEYNQREIAERTFHWMNGTFTDSCTHEEATTYDQA